MKVRMQETKHGSLDGFKTMTYLKEHIYDVPSEMSEYIAKAWLQRKICEIYQEFKLETKIVIPTETKKATKRRR